MKLFSIQLLLNSILRDHICARILPPSPRLWWTRRHGFRRRQGYNGYALLKISRLLSVHLDGSTLLTTKGKLTRSARPDSSALLTTKAAQGGRVFSENNSKCARPELVEGYKCIYLSHKPGFTIIESVLTLVIIAVSLTTLFSLQSKLIKSVFGSHDIIEHLIGVKNFLVKDDQEEYYKQGKALEKKSEGENYSIHYEPKSNKQFPVLSRHNNIIVEKITLSSKSVFINRDEFVFFRFNPESKR